MGDRARRLAGAGLCAGAFGAWNILKRPMPLEDVSLVKGVDARLWSCVTADGVTLRGKRYANPGGLPVILGHGFSANGYEFDAPREGRNLAVYLARLGLDVFLYNIRGTGRQPYISDPGDWDFSLDHFAAYDMPAVIDAVTRETGRKPCWVGHSMGGTILYMYLQGAVFEDGSLTTDPELARRRNEGLAACLTIASPAHFGWPEGAAFRDIMTSRPMRAALGAAVRMLKKRPPEKQRLGFLRNSSVLLHMLPRLSQVLACNPSMLLLFNPRNVEPDVMTLAMERMVDNISVGMTVQFLEGLLEGTCWDSARTCDYSAGMDRITCPLCFITGDSDFISHEQIRRYGYESISAGRKEFHCLEGFGHLDLVVGKDVDSKVYPVIAAWLEQSR